MTGPRQAEAAPPLRGPWGERRGRDRAGPCSGARSQGNGSGPEPGKEFAPRFRP
jgi:hypothetical protein